MVDGMAPVGERYVIIQGIQYTFLKNKANSHASSCEFGLQIISSISAAVSKTTALSRLLALPPAFKPRSMSDNKDVHEKF